MTPLERAVETHARNCLAIRGKAQKKERNTVAILEILPMKNLFETVTAIDPIGAVEIDPPKIRSLAGVVTLEANS